MIYLCGEHLCSKSICKFAEYDLQHQLISRLRSLKKKKKKIQQLEFKMVNYGIIYTLQNQHAHLCTVTLLNSISGSDFRSFFFSTSSKISLKFYFSACVYGCVC